MDDSPIRVGIAPVRSPWGGLDVIVVPDDDDAALRSGIPEDVVSLATQDRAARKG